MCVYLTLVYCRCVYAICILRIHTPCRQLKDFKTEKLKTYDCLVVYGWLLRSRNGKKEHF